VKRLHYLLFITILFFFSCKEQPLTFWSNVPANKLAPLLVEKMTSEEQLAQVFMLGLTTPKAPEELKRWITKNALGNIIIFAGKNDNLENLAQEINTLQQLAQSHPLQIPLFFATDQEGGSVRHIKSTATFSPGNLATGATQNQKNAFYTGYYLAQELKALGIHINLAPVVDLYTDYNSSIIATRSFGEEPTFVGNFAKEFYLGTQKAGLLACAKHFPGHGHTTSDSHHLLPYINLTKNELFKRELIPYSLLIQEKIPLIMVSHLAFPKILDNETPASMSSYFIKNILQEELGFQGLIISDDLMMQGALDYSGSLENALQKSILAGCHLVISSKILSLDKEEWLACIDLMKKNDEFAVKVKKAATKVIEEKLRFFKEEKSMPLYTDISKITKKIPNPEGSSFFEQLGKNSITQIKDEKNLFPIKTEGNGLLLIGQHKDFFKIGKKAFPECETFDFGIVYTKDDAKQQVQKLLPIAKKYKTAIITVNDAESAYIAEQLIQENISTIIVGLQAPIYALSVKKAGSVLLAYSSSPYSFVGAFAVLKGKIQPKGILPLLHWKSYE